MASESKLQASLLNAIDYLVNNRVQNLDRDKTIVASVITCSNAITQEYKLSYNGGIIVAYAQENANYDKDQRVYVLVPQGDMTERKTIISKATNASTNDSNITFVSSLLSDYNTIGSNTVDNNSLDPVCGLCSYMKESYRLLYQREPDAENPNLIDVDQEALRSYLSNAEAVMLEGSFKTRLPKAHRMGKGGQYGLQVVLAFRNKDYAEADADSLPPEAIKHVSYSIDSNTMVGNPMLFESWTDQYDIFSFDKDSYLYLESIMAYCRDFVTEDNKGQAELWGEDVFLKDVEFYGLRKIESKNGDYVLRLSTPNGAIFKSTTAAEQLTVLCSMKKQDATDLSDSTTFYWFAKDDRINSASEDYNLYGGSGWRYLKDKGANKLAEFTGYENRAYENKYMAVAVYKSSVILKEKFVLYNEACSRDIEITSNLGVRFSFDRGIPNLTCRIGGREENFETDKGRDDSLFDFSWSVTDMAGNVTTISRSYDELKSDYDTLLKRFNDDKVAKEDRPSYSDLAAIKSQMAQMEGVTFDRNHLSYPMSKVSTSATFSCSVYLRENETADSFFIGSATITLTNEGTAEPAGYSIIIENGDQVFQYSESGVSPCSDRYQDPLQILPLACHFYDPAGLEVNSETYSLTWQFPIADTMIKTPTTLRMNPSSGKMEWLVQQTCPFEIKDNYDYFSLDNQLLCLVNYDGQTFSRYTNLTFTKVGENGTNGTDVVAKISPKTSKPDDLFAIEIKHDKSLTSIVDNKPVNYIVQYSDGQSLKDNVLQFDLYNKNILLQTTNLNKTWKLSGSAAKSKHLSITSGGVVSYQIDAKGNTASGFRNTLIVRASTEYADEDGGVRQTYYAFYPMPVIEYFNSESLGYKIVFDKQKTLKTITYNADGRYPAYNEKQGVFFTLEKTSADCDIDSKYIVLQAEGGADDATTTAAFTLYETYGDNGDASVRKSGQYKIVTTSTDEEGKETQTESCFDHVYIKPNDTYNGAETNNLVHGRVFASKSAYEQGSSAEVEFYIPIHMSLNTYGLSSLNSWDGTKIDINEDENYILAPQIGAGIKTEENKFTGIVMGKATTYPGNDIKEQDSIGLLGYANGEQSLWLDAETGNATFGLPEKDPNSDNSRYTEGRIELRPGGTSKIGNWNIGSRSLYNMWAAPPMKSVKAEDGNYYAYKYNSATEEWELANDKPLSDAVISQIKKEYFGTDMPSATPEEVYTSYEIKNSDYKVDGATISFSPYSQGMILNSNPAYFSLKSMPLTRFNSSIKFGDANTALLEGDSIEVEMDPKKSNVFSIYRHTPALDSEGNTIPTAADSNLPKYTRYPLVGINANGQFYTNAIQDQESSMGIGKIGAFGRAAAQDAYIGAQFAYAGDNILKFYVKNNSSLSWKEGAANYVKDDKTLFLSTGTKLEDEYDRPFKIYGKSVELYAPDTTGKTSESSAHNLRITPTEAFFGHNVNDNSAAYVSMPLNADTRFKTTNGLTASVSAMTTLNANAGLTVKVPNGVGDYTFGNGRKTVVSGSGTDETHASSSISMYGGSTSDSWYGNLRLSKTSTDGVTLQFYAKNRKPNGTRTENENDTSQILRMTSSGTSFVTNEGFSIDNRKGQLFLQNDSASSLVLNASDHTFDKTLGAGARLSLVPPNGGANINRSTFTLTSGAGTIASVNKKSDDGMNSEGHESYINVNPGIVTRFVDIVGGEEGHDKGLRVSNNAWIGGDITVGNDVIATDDFCYTQDWTAGEGLHYSFTHKKIWQFILDIYKHLDSLKTEVNTNAFNISSLAGRVDTIEDTYATKSWVDKNYVTGASKDFVKNDTYSKHTHTLSSAVSEYSSNGQTFKAFPYNAPLNITTKSPD